MKKFSSHWRATILAAILLHAAFAAGVSYVAPLLAPAPNLQNVAPLEWVDVELVDAPIIDSQEISSDAAQDSLSTFSAEDLRVPELSTPETTFEPLKPPPSPKPVVPTKPPVQPEKPPAQSKTDTPTDKPVDKPQDTRQLMAKPPVTVKEVFPEKGGGLGYKGYVSIAVHIGKDGKVQSTEVLQSSGRYFVDEIALKAARQWTFRPALDQIGRPMECDKIITFDFKQFA